MSAGWAALAGAMFLGKKNKSNATIHVLLGTGLLWFGWFDSMQVLLR
jgi:Amt family ammonium transporter